MNSETEKLIIKSFTFLTLSPTPSNLLTSPTPNIEKKNGLNVYTSPDKTYQFSYPDNWFLQQINNYPYLYNYNPDTTWESMSNIKNKVKITFAVNANVHNYSSAKEYFLSQSQESENIIVNGIQGAKYETAPAPWGTIENTIFLLNSTKKYYSIIRIDYDLDKNEVDNILNTFEFIE